MTGQLTVGPAEAPIELHTHFIFPLEGGPPEEGARQLRFRDVRRFGSATLFDTRAELAAFFVEAGLGPEPFDLAAAPWRENGMTMRPILARSRCGSERAKIPSDDGPMLSGPRRSARYSSIMATLPNGEWVRSFSVPMPSIR